MQVLTLNRGDLECLNNRPSSLDLMTVACRRFDSEHTSGDLSPSGNRQALPDKARMVACRTQVKTLIS